MRRYRTKHIAWYGEEENAQPGLVSPRLRGRMGVALADLFDEYGPKIYSEIVSTLKDTAVSTFQSSIEELEEIVNNELGNRGLLESKKHIREWVNGIVEDIIYYGMSELALALGNMANDVVSDYIQYEDKDENDEEMVLMSDKDLPSIEEEPEVSDSDIEEMISEDQNEETGENEQEEENAIGAEGLPGF